MAAELTPRRDPCPGRHLGDPMQPGRTTRPPALALARPTRHSPLSQETLPLLLHLPGLGRPGRPGCLGAPLRLRPPPAPGELHSPPPAVKRPLTLSPSSCSQAGGSPTDGIGPRPCATYANPATPTTLNASALRTVSSPPKEARHASATAPSPYNCLTLSSASAWSCSTTSCLPATGRRTPPPLCCSSSPSSTLT